MSSAVILQHGPAFGPGRLVPILRDFGIPTQVRRLDLGDEVPHDLDGVRVLIVLGGAQNVADMNSEKYHYLAQEVDLIKRVVHHDRPMLGIGLGAQLLARAAGANVYPNVKAPPKAPHGHAPPTEPPRAATEPAAPPPPPQLLPEFGWLPVYFPFPGGAEPIVMGMVDGAPMFHWHHDTFDLPRLPAPPNAPPPPAPQPPTGNALLSSSKLCKSQAFRFRNRLFGFQYHMELTEVEIEKILSLHADELIAAAGPAAPATIAEQSKRYYHRYARLGERVIKNFVQFLKIY